MKFKAYPKAEIFCVVTKRTLGHFDKNGFYETEDPRTITAIKALGFKQVGGEDVKADLTPLEYYSKLPKAELVKQAMGKGIGGYKDMAKEQLIKALIGE